MKEIIHDDVLADVDKPFMDHALALAHQAFRNNEIPVGAIVVQHTGNTRLIVGQGFNQREQWSDPTAHAEVVALREAGRRLGRWQLHDCDLYVTLEPCPMCAGAIVNARIRRLIFTCSDPKAGAVRTLYRLADDKRLNHRAQIVGPMPDAASAELLREFFS
ncbi:MAG: nucleoside deaminase, partial [Phycisphaerales bacterium]|nr:nucleoside deaminase [Phycisphaerales bacterium]